MTEMHRSKILDRVVLTAIAGLIVASAVAALATGWNVYRRWPRPSIAEKTRAAAIAQARQDGKHVLLVFGFRGESWSDRLDDYHADPEVKSVLEKYFVLARVEIQEPGGVEMYMQLGDRGAPAFSILDATGAMVANSGEADQNVGFPNDDHQVARYLQALQTACPKISNDDLALLRRKLEEMRVPAEKGELNSPSPSGRGPG